MGMMENQQEFLMMKLMNMMVQVLKLLGQY